MLAVPAPFAPGFDCDTELLQALARRVATVADVRATVFPEWYASYVFVAVEGAHGERWIVCNKYRPIVAVATVEPSLIELTAVPPWAWVTADKALRDALAPNFRALSVVELGMPLATAIDVDRLTEHERPYYRHGRSVVDLFFNNLD